MSFVSTQFLCFFALFVPLYYLARRPDWQNLLILLASYVFYGAWDWRFLGLIYLISVTNFVAARVIVRSTSWRKGALVAAVTVSLGVLAAFKYFGFFLESAVQLFGLFGLNVDTPVFHIVLPVGISFFTFQALSYTIDVYRGDAHAENNLTRFLAYIAFFPQLVAGPIERAGHLLRQFERPRRVTGQLVHRGIWLIVYGYFVKVVIADGLAPIVDAAYTSEQLFGWSVILGTFGFGIQIYADFLGYSLIAKGLAALLGLELIFNFRLPYWATSITEFWHRWHISLSTWLRDYLYISLGGNRRGELTTYRNLMITMTLGGLWHGANWTFIVWGLLHGVALCLWRRTPALHALPAAVGWLFTMSIVFSGWFFFRAADATEMLAMLSALANLELLPVHWQMTKAILVAVSILAVLEFPQWRHSDAWVWTERWPVTTTFLMGVMIAITLMMASASRSTFIYFQF